MKNFCTRGTLQLKSQYVFTYIHILCKQSVLPFVILIFSVTAVSQCSNSNKLITSCWPTFLRFTITQNTRLILLLFVITIMQDIYNYVPEAKPVSTVYRVAATL